MLTFSIVLRRSASPPGQVLFDFLRLCCFRILIDKLDFVSSCNASAAICIEGDKNDDAFLSGENRAMIKISS
jgi:hypothetical protein